MPPFFVGCTAFGMSETAIPYYIIGKNSYLGSPVQGEAVERSETEGEILSLRLGYADPPPSSEGGKDTFISLQ